MERDSILAHGTAEFLRESMMERSDKYSVNINNKTIFANEKAITLK